MIEEKYHNLKEGNRSTSTIDVIDDASHESTTRTESAKSKLPPESHTQKRQKILAMVKKGEMIPKNKNLIKYVNSFYKTSVSF